MPSYFCTRKHSLKSGLSLFLFHLDFCLLQLLSGGNHDIDVDDLRKHTQYTGGYSEGSRAVKLFWEVRALEMPVHEPYRQFSLYACNYVRPIASVSRIANLGYTTLSLMADFLSWQVPYFAPICCCVLATMDLLEPSTWSSSEIKKIHVYIIAWYWMYIMIVCQSKY